MGTLKIDCTHAIFLADIHFGVRLNTEEWQNIQQDYFIKWFLPKVKEYFATKPSAKPCFMVLGDVFDDRKSIDINVENLAIDIFETLSQLYPVYIINGNHDLSKRTNKGNTSLRSIDLIENVKLINEPTLLTITSGRKSLAKIAAIPYLGDYELETRQLQEASGTTDYALMHTDLMNCKMDNGMLITSGNNPDMYKGHIFAGHIHRRQENKNVTYVGSPYQLTKNDIGNQKGVYILDFAKKSVDTIDNDFSPIFQSIKIADFLAMDEEAKRAYLDNNFTYVTMTEDEMTKARKKVDIFQLGDGTNARFVKPIIQRNKFDIEVGNEEEVKELSIGELINESIDQLNIDDDAKDRLKKMSISYLSDAESKMAQTM